MFKHLRENDMTYLEHLAFAVSHGVSAIVLGIALIVHGILPFLFPRAGRALKVRLSEDYRD